MLESGGQTSPRPPMLDDVLSAVLLGPKGLITITKDLALEKCQVLRPKEFTGCLSTLWKAFIELLREVLPIADLVIQTSFLVMT
jgi:hypothetical protein